MKKLLILLVVLLSLTGCSNKKTATRTEFLLDTFVTVTLYGSDDEAILSGAMKLCAQYDAMLDRFSPQSQISLLNGAAGPVRVDPELYLLLEKALHYCELSQGRYDITVAPVMDLWNFRGETNRPPEPEAVAQALERVDWRNVVLLGDDTVRLDHGAQIDLGSIAKGYIADRLTGYLEERGVEGATVNLGGNVAAVGSKPGNKPFVIGVQKPFEEREEIVGTLEITDLSLVSSGVYERYFIGEDGALYHHILDATNGMPADPGLLSVTIISPSSADADAMSTLCFLLGPAEGMELVEETEGTEAVFLTMDGQTLLSSGLTERYKPA